MLIKKIEFSKEILVGHRNSDFEDIESKYNKNTFIDLSIEIHDDYYVKTHSILKSKEVLKLTQPLEQFDLDSKFIVEKVRVTSKKLFETIENRALRLRKNDYTVLVLKDNAEGQKVINEICDLLNNLIFSETNVNQKENEQKRIKDAEKEFFELTGLNSPGDFLQIAKYTLFSNETKKELVLLNDVFFLSDDTTFMGLNLLMSRNRNIMITNKVKDKNIYDGQGYNLTCILPIIKQCFYKVDEISTIDFFDSSVSSNTKSNLTQKKYSALNSALHESVFGTAATIDRNQRAMNQQVALTNNPAVLSISFKNILNGELIFFSPNDKYIETEKYIKQIVQKIQFKIKTVEGQKKETKSENDFIFEKIIKLKELLDSGVITQEEFDAKKKELLSQI